MNKEHPGGFERTLLYFRHDLEARGLWEERVKDRAQRGKEGMRNMAVAGDSTAPRFSGTQTSDEPATNPGGPPPRPRVR